MKAVVLRHVAVEGAGALGPILEARGFTVEMIDAPTQDLDAIDPVAPDLFVVLGGPLGANDTEDFPFLEREVALLERRLAAQRPTLGICLGAQLMARALGARVYPARRKEVGWAPITLTEAGRSSPLAKLGAETPTVLHWHGDTFDLPDDAERLASTESCPNQAFSLGQHAMALQFHLEVLPAEVEHWLVSYVAEIAATRGVSVPELRADTARCGPALQDTAPGVFTAWLEQAGL